jgi:predicted GNAT superfamily acetyltransferase
MTAPRIRNLISHSDFNACVDIQKIVWRHSAEDLTPAHQFCMSVETGAILLGAFVEGRLAGFVYSVPAFHRGRLCQHSHLLAVLPEYQGYGLGKRLKWAQRSRAVTLGYNLITWTYDPLQVRNAGLNLHTLGAESRIYLPNFYGGVASLVFADTVPSDRLKVEWSLTSRRVRDRLCKKYPSVDLGRAAKALEGRAKSGRLEPVPVRWDNGAGRLLIEIPRDLAKYRHEPGYILAWQSALHRVLSRSFGRGRRLTDFIFGERCYYVLGRDSSSPRKGR